MAHKTITISDDAYEALAKSKRENESFTKVILRLTSESGRASSLLEHLRGLPADEGLAGEHREGDAKDQERTAQAGQALNPVALRLEEQAC